jgi:hypothetical protein
VEGKWRGRRSGGEGGVEGKVCSGAGRLGVWSKEVWNGGEGSIRDCQRLHAIEPLTGVGVGVGCNLL